LYCRTDPQQTKPAINFQRGTNLIVRQWRVCEGEAAEGLHSY